MRDSRRSLIDTIAGERIGILFGLAEGAAGSDARLMHRYVSELRKIGSHYKVKIPKGMKDRICTGCNSIMVPGLNSKVRVVSSKGYVAYTCTGCGKERHLRY